MDFIYKEKVSGANLKSLKDTWIDLSESNI